MPPAVEAPGEYTERERAAHPVAQPSASPGRPPPGPAGLPFLGPLIPALRDPVAWTMHMYRRYGEVVAFRVAGLPVVLMFGAEANRYILVEAAPNFLVAPLTDRLGTRWILGEGLAVIDDPAHAEQRRLILPAFHRARIETYQGVMRESTGELLDQWIPGAEYDIAAEMHKLALIIVGRTLLGTDLTGETRDLADAVAELAQVLNDPVRLALARLPFDIPGLGSGGRLRRAVRRIRAQLSQVVTNHEVNRADDQDVAALLSAVRDDVGGGLSPAQVRDQLATLFLAGHETSANALAWACYLLAQHPRVARKLLHELNTQLGNEPASAHTIARLPYLDQVVKEVLRLCPPIFAFNRTPRQSFVWHGYRIAAGSIVFYSPYVSHHMSAYFAAPETFRPERFAPAGGEPHPPYAYIPFGAGPRACIGAAFAMMELKTVLAMTLQRFRLDLVPGQTVTATVQVTLQPKQGIKMRVQRQDGQAAWSPATVRGNVVGAVPGPL